MSKGVLLLACMVYCVRTVIILKQVQIQTNIQKMTIPFGTTFRSTPYFSFYISSGSIASTQFSVTYLENQTSLSYTTISITFVTLVNSNQFSNGGFLIIQLVVSDRRDYSFNFGVVPLNISASSLTFTGFSLNYTDSKMEIYPLALPMSYTRIQNSTTRAKNQIVLLIQNQPQAYMVQGKIYFSYIYFTNIYSSNQVLALNQGFSQTSLSYQFSYATFAFTPEATNILLAVRSYISIADPFFYLQTVKQLEPNGGDIDNFSIGYVNVDGSYFYTDAFFFSNNFGGCPKGQYLYYLVYFQTLPYSCQSCDPSCYFCFPPNPSYPNITDSNSCTSCPANRYLNNTSIYNMKYGNCLCYPGMDTLNGECVQCSLNCLSFKVVYIQTTNQSNFLLYFSYPNIVQKVLIDQNLVIKINGSSALTFNYEQTNDAVYTISLSLDSMLPCESKTCSISFSYKQPYMILLPDESKALSNSQCKVQVQNFINYYNQLPAQLQKAFEVLGIVMLGTYTSGYTSLFKILFELEQLIDAHKYLNLTLPIIYNQLVEQLQNFKFMDFTNLMPQQIRTKLNNFIPVDLDQFGSARMIYYDQGVNYAKNIITGFISIAFMLTVNYLIYLILHLIPLKPTRILAKKISKRKIITLHDSFDQLVFPVFFFSMTSFEYLLLHPYLYWIYAFAALSGFLTISAPFFVVVYVYLNRNNEHKVQIFEDLLQDNTMSQPVTYIYYIFNYYRKIFFALCLTDTLPGLVQIYLLICLNGVHLGFQVYLISAKTYKSKSKVVVRFINSICVIAVEVLIMVYNLSWYDKETMINIGLSCFYLSITTALLNIIDSFIKLLDTIFQEISQKKVAPEELEMFKQNPVLKQFSKQIFCNLGQELKPANIVKDPKQIKFEEDKQMMEQTFHKGDEISDMSDQVSDAVGDKSQVEEVQLVFIDSDWTNVYPLENDNNFVVEREKIKNMRKLSLKMPEQSQSDLYQIPEQINAEVEKISKQKQFKKVNLSRKLSKNKNDQNLNQNESSSRRTLARAQSKVLQIKPIKETKIQDEEVSEISLN